MCKSQAEGGARCAAHTRPTYEAALASMGDLATNPDKYKASRTQWEASEEGDAVFDAIAQHASTRDGQKEIEAKSNEIRKVNGKINTFALFMTRARHKGLEITETNKETVKAIKKAKAKLVGHRGGGAGTGSVETLKPSRGTTADTNCLAIHPTIGKYWRAEDNNGIGPEQCTKGSNGQLNYRCADCQRLVERREYRVNSLTKTLANGGVPVCDDCDPTRKKRFAATQQELTTLTAALGDDPDAFNALSPALQYSLMQKMGLLKGNADSMNRNIAMSIVHGDLTLKDVVLATDLTEIDGQVREDLGDDDNADLATIADIDIADDDSQHTPTVAKIDQALAATGVLALIDENSDLARSIQREANETLWERAYLAKDLDEYTEFVNSRRGMTPQGDAAIDRFTAELEEVRTRETPEGYAVERFDKHGNPISMEPTLAQQRFATMVEDRRRVMNWSGTGAGKTLAATLAVQGSGARETLIVCPKAVVDQWENEFKGGFPDNTEVRIGLPVPGQTLPPLADGVNRVWIANYDKFQDDPETLHKGIGPLADRVDAVVFDEIHMAKTGGTEEEASKRRVALTKFTDRAGRKNPELVVIGASATPVVNNLAEAQSVLRLVEGPGSKKFKTESTLKNAAAAHHRLASAGVRHMPTYETTLTRENVDVDVTADVHKIQAQINDYRKKSRTPNAPVHPAMMEKALLPYKMPKIMEKVKANNGPSIVYTEYTKDMVGPMREAFEKEGMRVGTYTGDESDAQRAAALKKFNNGELDVLIGSRPIATGIDGLQNTSHNLVVASMAWTAAQDDQLVGRLQRRGQQHNVNVSYILTEAKVGDARWSWCKDNRQKRIHFKRDIANAAVDGVLPDGALDSKQHGAEKALDGLKSIASALVRSEHNLAA